jgi:hypothetical protein
MTLLYAMRELFTRVRGRGIQRQLDELRKVVEDCQASLDVIDRRTEAMTGRRDDGQDDSGEIGPS